MQALSWGDDCQVMWALRLSLDAEDTALHCPLSTQAGSRSPGAPLLRPCWAWPLGKRLSSH